MTDVRRLLPALASEELDDLYVDLELPAGKDRPHVYLGMVASADGAATVDGRTRRLGGEADRMAFRRLRETCDVVLVGAGTARIEDYGPPRAHAGTVGRRQERGLAPLPRIAVVTRSARLDPQARLFCEPDLRPLVLTVDEADTDHLGPVADVVRCGPGDVDLARALAALHARGARRVLCEGGPSLNAQLVAAGFADELFLTVTPTLVGGTSERILEGPVGDPRGLELLEARHHEGELLLRYRIGGPTG